MRCPGEKVQVRVPVFICGCEHVCVCVCVIKIHSISLSHSLTWKVGGLVLNGCFFCSVFPSDEQNHGVQKGRLVLNPELRSTPEAEAGRKHTPEAF